VYNYLHYFAIYRPLKEVKGFPLHLIKIESPSPEFDLYQVWFGSSEPILTEVGANYSYVKGIQNSSKEGQPLSPRGDYSKRVKVH
jgi:hypothetical protein